VSKFLGFDYEGDESGDEVPMFVSSSPTATFDQVLEALLGELEGSSKIPFSSTVMIQREVVVGLIDDLRATLPEELRQADRINRDRDAILQAAEDSKNQMLATARRESNALVESRPSWSDPRSGLEKSWPMPKARFVPAPTRPTSTYKANSPSTTTT